MTRKWSAVLLSAALAVSACSGSDGEETTGASATTSTSLEPSTTTSTSLEPPTTTTTVPSRGAAVLTPTIEGPITVGDRDLPANPAPPEILQEYGYVEEEFFISGEAAAYTPVGDLSDTGEWEAEASSTAPYTTRILVRRPVDSADSNGVVAVEWMNVTAGQDSDPDFGFLYPQMLAEGTIWVGVSAQFNGVDGDGLGIPIEGVTAVPLKTADPTRYEPIDHPGDDYSYDIYSQAAQAIRRPSGADPVGAASVEHVIALGESQSAGRLGTYINAVHPIADIYDGFFVHSRSGGFAPLAAEVEQAAPVLFRTDLTEPIFVFQTETDVARSHPARQPDTDLLVTWELAGAAHADQSQLDYGFASGLALDPDRDVPDFESMCGGTLNQGPQPLVTQRAWHDLLEWVINRTPPASAPALEVSEGAIARDELGIAVGGIRTPDVDVPVAVHSGAPRPDASVICSLFGSTTPLEPPQVLALYPTHEIYVDAVRESAEVALDAGFLLPEGVESFVAEAEAARQLWG